MKNVVDKKHIINFLSFFIHLNLFAIILFFTATPKPLVSHGDILYFST